MSKSNTELIITSATDTTRVLEHITIRVVLEYSPAYHGTPAEQQKTNEIAGRMIALAMHYFDDVHECDDDDYQDAIWLADPCVECHPDDQGICVYCGKKA